MNLLFALITRRTVKKMRPIIDVARDLGIPEKYIEFYGKYKAKIDLNYRKELEGRPTGKLIVTTAITATPYGEGKTTTSIGTSMAMNKIGMKALVTLREPSMGPVFGIKGGGTGGGKSQVVPMEDINLHFTGDIHAITSAHNLLSAMLDNHLHFGNALNLDVRQIVWKRALDMNDRALRKVIVGIGGRLFGVPREDGFEITAASEIMAIMGLAKDYKDLKSRLDDIIIGYTRDGRIVRAKELKATGSMAALLRDALKPNLVQTSEGTPAFVHIGPFANIAHGTNSIIATQMALKMADYVITETGFGSDLGAEKFFNFVAPTAGFHPDASMVITTISTLKYHGGANDQQMKELHLDLLEKGMENLYKHVENVQLFGITPLVVINKKTGDFEEEIDFVRDHLKKNGIESAVSEAFAKGGEGAIEVAEKLKKIADAGSNYKPLYDIEKDPIEKKIEIVATKIYGAKGVVYTNEGYKNLEKIVEDGFDNYPIIVAKTNLSLTDDKTRIGRPRDFTITVKGLRVFGGARFVVVYTGDVMTMPGLSRKPAAENIYLDDDGVIHNVR